MGAMYNIPNTAASDGDTLLAIFKPTDDYANGTVYNTTIQEITYDGDSSSTVVTNVVADVLSNGAAASTSTVTFAVAQAGTSTPNGSTTDTSMGRLGVRGINVNIPQTLTSANATLRGFLTARNTSRYFDFMVRFAVAGGRADVITLGLNSSTSIDARYVSIGSTGLTSQYQITDAAFTSRVGNFTSPILNITGISATIPSIVLQQAALASLPVVTDAVRAASVATKQDVANATLAGVVTENGTVITPDLTV